MTKSNVIVYSSGLALTSSCVGGFLRILSSRICLCWLSNWFVDWGFCGFIRNSRTIRRLIRMSLTISRNLTTKMYQGPTHHHVDPSSSLITTPPHHPHTQSPAIIPTGISSHPTPPPSQQASQLCNEDVEVSEIEVTTDQRRPAAVLELPSRSESVSSHSATTYVPQRMSRLAVSMPGAGCRVYFAG